jgi:hypothetical protein
MQPEILPWESSSYPHKLAERRRAKPDTFVFFLFRRLAILILRPAVEQDDHVSFPLAIFHLSCKDKCLEG